MRLVRFRFADRIATGAADFGSDTIRVLRGTFFEDPVPTGETGDPQTASSGPARVLLSSRDTTLPDEPRRNLTLRGPEAVIARLSG